MTGAGSQVVVGVIAIVCANTAFSSWYARHEGPGIAAASRRFAVLLGLNFAFVGAASVILADSESFPVGHGLFFAYLVTLVIWLYDTSRPVYDGRFKPS